MKYQGLFVINEPGGLRISPALAKEIGFNESIFLLQIEYLIGISNTKEIDSKLWTYQSLQDLKDEYFEWWSISTLSRIAKKLEKMGLIHIGNYNKIGYDRTQWYALNEEGINKLNSVKMNEAIFQNEKSKRAKRKMEARKLKNGSAQIETPIPETTPKTPIDSYKENIFFSDPAFLLAWDSFEKHRKEKRKPITEESAKRVVAKLSKYSLEIATEALNIAIDRGWTGVFPESINKNGGLKNGNGNHREANQRLPKGV